MGITKRVQRGNKARGCKGCCLLFPAVKLFIPIFSPSFFVPSNQSWFCRNLYITATLKKETGVGGRYKKQEKGNHNNTILVPPLYKRWGKAYYRCLLQFFCKMSCKIFASSFVRFCGLAKVCALPTARQFRYSH